MTKKSKSKKREDRLEHIAKAILLETSAFMALSPSDQERLEVLIAEIRLLGFSVTKDQIDNKSMRLIVI